MVLAGGSGGAGAGALGGSSAGLGGMEADPSPPGNGSVTGLSGRNKSGRERRELISTVGYKTSFEVQVHCRLNSDSV